MHRECLREVDVATAQPGPVTPRHNRATGELTDSAREDQTIRLGKLAGCGENSCSAFAACIRAAASYVRQTMNLPSPSDTPWRTSTLLVVMALTLAALSAAALRVDMPLARLQDSIDPPGDLSRLIVLSEAFAYGGTVVLIVLAAVTLDPRGWRVAPRLLLLAYGSGVIANMGKLLLARTRPREADLDGSVLGTFGGWFPPLTGNENMQSFPSGHTATAVGLAIALTMLYPRGWWLFGILAILAATQRIDSQAHYLSDVLAGAAISFLVAAIVTAPTPLARWLQHIEQQNPLASFGPRPDA